MPILNIGNECCLCPIPLGSQDCNDLQVSIAEAYYTCPKNITALAYASDPNDCATEAEITAFELVDPDDDALTPLPLESLLQPISFVKLDDNTGALHEFDDNSDGGNVSLNHTFTFKINATTPTEEAALNRMLGREVCLVIKYKNGRWRFINHTGGMVCSQKTGNSNQSWTEVVISGQVNDPPLYISYTDNGVWADTNLIPVGLGGIINA